MLAHRRYNEDHLWRFATQLGNNSEFASRSTRDFHTDLAVTNAANPSVIRLRIEGLKAEALARMLIEVWPQVTKHVDHGAAMITITDKKVRVRSLPIAP